MDAAFDDLAARLGARRAIGADDVLALRRLVYGADAVTRAEAEVLIALDVAADTRAPEWGEFLAEVLVDLAVRQQDPADYVDDATADWLMRALTAAGRLRRDGTLAELARVVDDATEVPPALAAFALARARDAVVAGGQVSAADIALLRQVIFAGGGEGGVGVTREEAEALFDIDAACRAVANDPAWPDFFARTIAACLTAASPFQPESREDALRDEAWLASRESPAGFMKAMARGPDVAGAAREILHPFADEEAEWSGAEADSERAEAAAAPITDDEAAWLKQRIARGGAPSEAVRRLQTFLNGGPARATAPQPATSPASSGARVFGHRGQPPAADASRGS
jgi:hypothetical protein